MAKYSNRHINRNVTFPENTECFSKEISVGIYDDVYIYLLRPGRDAVYIVINPSVCASVCLSASISLEPLGRLTRNFVCRMQIPCGRGSVLFRRLCVTLCTSGFMDDVTCGRSGPYERAISVAKCSAPRCVAIPGRSPMSVNALFGIVYF